MSQTASRTISSLRIVGYTVLYGFLSLFILSLAVMFFLNHNSSGPGPLFVNGMLVVLGGIAIWSGYQSIQRAKSR